MGYWRGEYPSLKLRLRITCLRLQFKLFCQAKQVIFPSETSCFQKALEYITYNVYTFGRFPAFWRSRQKGYALKRLGWAGKLGVAGSAWSCHPPPWKLIYIMVRLPLREVFRQCFGQWRTKCPGTRGANLYAGTTHDAA